MYNTHPGASRHSFSRAYLKSSAYPNYMLDELQLPPLQPQHWAASAPGPQNAAAATRVRGGSRMTAAPRPSAHAAALAAASSAAPPATQPSLLQCAPPRPPAAAPLRLHLCSNIMPVRTQTLIGSPDTMLHAHPSTAHFTGHGEVSENRQMWLYARTALLVVHNTKAHPSLQAACASCHRLAGIGQSWAR